MKVTSIFFIAAIGGTLLTGCKKDDKSDKPDPRLPYFATWRSEWNIKFSANEIYVEPNGDGGGWYKISPITWKMVTNTNDETKDNFPSGYKITGLVSEEEESGWGDVGTPFGDNWAYFLHKDGNSIIEQGDDNDWWEEMTKNISKTKKTSKRLTVGLKQEKTRGAGKRQ